MTKNGARWASERASEHTRFEAISGRSRKQRRPLRWLAGVHVGARAHWLPAPRSVTGARRRRSRCARRRLPARGARALYVSASAARERARRVLSDLSLSSAQHAADAPRCISSASGERQHTPADDSAARTTASTDAARGATRCRSLAHPLATGVSSTARPAHATPKRAPERAPPTNASARRHAASGRATLATQPMRTARLGRVHFYNRGRRSAGPPFVPN